MIHTIKEGKTILVDGPSCIHLLSGEMSVFGAGMRAGEKLVVRKGKRMPLEALGDAEVELRLGDSTSCEEIDGSAIPDSWKAATDKVLSSEDYKEVLVLGGTDSGKTGFCTYLINKALGSEFGVSLIDGDMGQSEIGTPGTISFCPIQKPTVDLFSLWPEDLVFVGATNPSGMVEAALKALATLKPKASALGSDLLVVNTDGWVEGDSAVDYKIRLAESIKPDIVIALQGGSEMTPILTELRNSEMELSVIESPKSIKKRDKETRKALRESAYKKYLKDAKIKSYPLSWVKIEGELRDIIKNGYSLKRRIEGVLNKEILYCKETSTHILFVLEKGARLLEEEAKKIESELGKKAAILKEGEEEGLLVALVDAVGKFLGTGTVCNVDFSKETIRINTPVDTTVAKICVGEIKLDNEGNEICLDVKPH